MAPLAEETSGSEWDAMRLTPDAWGRTPPVRSDEAALRQVVDEAPAIDLALLRPLARRVRRARRL